MVSSLGLGCNEQLNMVSGGVVGTQRNGTSSIKLIIAQYFEQNFSRLKRVHFIDTWSILLVTSFSIVKYVTFPTLRLVPSPYLSVCGGGRRLDARVDGLPRALVCDAISIYFRIQFSPDSQTNKKRLGMDLFQSH